jgi:two-component system, LuxR family, sensor kinase FixL
MSESGHAMVDHGHMAVEPASSRQSHDALRRRVLALPTVLLGSVYLVVYVFLDWISSIEQYGPLVNNSWNPNTGASIAVAIIFGPRMIPFMFIAPLLGDLVVRQFPFSFHFELASTILIGSVYGAAALFLLEPKQRFDRTLESISSLALLTFTTAVSTALAAVSYVGIVVMSGLLPAADFPAVAVSYWVGDAIGIMVLTPFALIMWSRPHALHISVETLLQLVAIIAALIVVHVYWTLQHLQLFYLLFVPVVWMAVRAGIEGTCVGILIIQLGFISGFLAFPEEIQEMPKIQAFMLVLASTGLFAGTLVTERRRTEAQLRLHQASLTRLAQLGSMGELAAALAHELNQPLMAAGTYTRLVDDAIHTGNTEAGPIAETAKKAVAQVERAAEVVRRLRALVRLDRSSRAACRVDRIVRETIDLCRHDLDRLPVRIHQAVAADLPPVMVDILQIEQALLNLVRNSIDAIDGAGQGTISIEAVPAGTDFVEVRVRDSGPGFPPDLVANPFLPFLSTKKEGLGFGLPLCRSLIEANGGRIWLDVNSPGAAIHFTLPIAPPPGPPP